MIFTACGADKTNSVESFGQNKSEGNVASCLCTDLVTDSTGLFIKDKKPYTGNCFLNYQNSDFKYIEKQIVKGLVNGNITYYNQIGEVLYREKYEKGNRILDLTLDPVRCLCSDLSKKGKDNKSHYKDQIFTGDCYSLFPDSEQPFIEAAYANGYRDGMTYYYSKEGTLLYTEMYEAGELKTVIYPEK